jgi:hypothetical protein
VEPRRASLLAAGAAAVVLLCYVFLLPDVQSIGGGNCPDPGRFFLDADDYLTVEPSYLRRYDAVNDTTFLVPWCSHGTTDFALQVKGGHNRTMRYLLLVPDADVTSDRIPLNPPLRGEYPSNITYALSTRFEAGNFWLHGSFFAAFAGFAIVSFASWLEAPFARARLIPMAFGFAALGGGLAAKYALIFLYFPVLGFLLMGPVAGAACLMIFASPRHPIVRVLGWSLLCFLVVTVWTGFFWDDLLPGPPPAS